MVFSLGSSLEGGKILQSQTLDLVELILPLFIFIGSSGAFPVLQKSSPSMLWRSLVAHLDHHYCGQGSSMTHAFRKAQAKRHSLVLFQPFSLMREIDSAVYLGGFPDLLGVQSINR